MLVLGRVDAAQASLATFVALLQPAAGADLTTSLITTCKALLHTMSATEIAILTAGMSHWRHQPPMRD